MRKGDHKFLSDKIQPIRFIPNNPINIPEYFIDITDRAAPGILPYYMISNYGRIWHKYECKFLTVNVDSKGYLCKPLFTYDGEQKIFRIHRLVMLTFDYFPGCENYSIKFNDGNKANPCIWNLSWSQEEDYRCIPKEENEDLVRTACELLQDINITLKQIAEITGLPYTMIQAIQNKRSWTHISKDYDIKERKINNNFSTDQIHKLCEYYQSVPKDKSIILDVYCKQAIEKSLGIIDPAPNLIRAAKKILTKESYTNISNYYNF